jgi:hypothetical protein
VDVPVESAGDVEWSVAAFVNNVGVGPQVQELPCKVRVALTHLWRMTPSLTLKVYTALLYGAITEDDRTNGTTTMTSLVMAM